MTLSLPQELHVLQLPLRNTFRGIDTREVLVFRGVAGWSEFSPFTEYSDLESLTWLKAALEAAANPWPELYRNKIAINATLPVVAADAVPGILKRFNGCTTIKIKVDDFESGAERVAATLECIPDAKIRLDVNGGWDLATALSHTEKYFERFGEVFEYIEQPSHSLEVLRELHQRSPIKIAADESIRKHLSSDLAEIAECADIAILKWQPLGGFVQAHTIAKTIGLPVVISSALETGIGISHGLALAASFPELPYACGLGTTSLFLEDICGDQFTVNEGFLEVQSAEPMDLERFRAPTERQEWWQNRLMRIGELL